VKGEGKLDVHSAGSVLMPFAKNYKN